MPRYFFQIHDGNDMLDREGTVLPDLAAARVSAVQLAGAVLADSASASASADWVGEAWWMDIQDEAGRTLFTLKVCAALEA